MAQTRWGAIAQDLEEQILSGKLPPNAKLPSEADLGRMYGVSRMTVRQSLAALEQNGRVIRVHGSGTYVPEEAPIRRRGNDLGSFHEELGLPEEDVETRVLVSDVSLPPAWATARLGMTDTQSASRFDRVRVVHNRVVSFQQAWVPLLVDPGLTRTDLIAGSIYRTLRERRSIEIDRAEQEVTASIATVEVASVLGCPVGTPLIDVTRLSFSTAGEAVVAAHSWTLPDYPLTYALNHH